jgi:hypothetical protein
MLTVVTEWQASFFLLSHPLLGDYLVPAHNCRNIALSGLIPNIVTIAVIILSKFSAPTG